MLADTPRAPARRATAAAQRESNYLGRALFSASRGPAATRELRARTIVSAARSCLDVATEMWVRSGGTQALDTLLDTAIRAVQAEGLAALAVLGSGWPLIAIAAWLPQALYPCCSCSTEHTAVAVFRTDQL
jgi:hypothetical protein